MTTDQDKQQAIEDYFTDMGWEPIEGLGMWKHAGEDCFSRLPDIIYHSSSFKKWLLGKMGRDGYHYYITPATYGEPIKFVWLNVSGDKISKYEEVVIDNEILLAAVKAATRYWREKDAKGS